MNKLLGSMCGNQIVSETVSPSGKKKIVVFVRDCGATTGFSTQVSLKRLGQKLCDNECGNIVIIDDDYTEENENRFGGVDISVEWISNNKIMFRMDEAAEFIKKKEKLKGVSFLYE